MSLKKIALSIILLGLMVTHTLTGSLFAIPSNAQNKKIAKLIHQLKDQSKRAETQKALVAIGSPALSALLNVTHNRSVPTGIRAAAIQVIGEIGNKKATEPLLSLLAASKGVLQVYTIQALGDLRDSRALPDLFKRLSDRKLRLAVAVSLGQIGDKKAVPPLLASLSLKDNEYTQQAILALGKLKDRRATYTLIPLVSSPNVMISTAAVEALGEIGDPRAVKPILKSLDPKNASAYCHQLAVLGKLKDLQALDSLTQALKDPRTQPKKTAIKALGELGSEAAVARLLTVIDSNSENFAPLAVTSLGKIKRPKAAETLFELAFNHHNAFLAWLALNTLSKMGSSGIDVVLSKLQVKKTRQNAIKVLERMGKPAIPILLKKLTSKTLAPFIIKVLGDIGDPAALSSLLGLLSDKNVALITVQAIGKIGDRRAVPALLKMLRQKNLDSKIHVEILYALGKIGDQRARKDIRRILKQKKGMTASIKRASIITLGRLADRKAVPLLIPLLAEDFSHRLDVILVLGDLRAKSAVGHLLKILPKTQDHHFQAILEALVKIQAPGSITSLRSLIKSKKIKKNIAVISALVRLGSPKVFKELEQGLAHSDRKVRHQIIGELAKIRDKRSIMVLINALNEKDYFLKIEVREGLRILTGKDFGDQPENWEQWWKQSRHSFRFPRDK